MDRFQAITVRFCLVSLALLCYGRLTAAGDATFKVPDGFEAILWADDDLATNIYAMTTDSRGRIVVSGPGYIKTLIDTDADGRADRAELFTDQLTHGSQGLCFVGNDLVCVGNGAVNYFRDADADGRADGPSEIWTRFGASNGGEHLPHAIIHGPDGYLYLIGGNNSGFNASHVSTPGSPIKQIDQGTLIRFTTEGKNFETLAHGFRNPYDIAFNARGHIFTYDSDGERDEHLPWYTGTRIFDVSIGQHHGWMLPGYKRSWNRPEYFPDTVGRVIDLGRGSPTGILIYRHRAFPKRYHGGMFATCWSLGRIYFVPMETAGSSYRGSRKIFMNTRGKIGFAPVDVVVGPEGDLFVAIGGRKTRGGVFRIRYTGPKPSHDKESSPLIRILDAPQPLAAWSRAEWGSAAQRLGDAIFHQAACNPALSELRRMRAIEILVEMFDGIAAEEAQLIVNNSPAPVAARATWALGRNPIADSYDTLITLSTNENLLVQRAAYEALIGNERKSDRTQDMPDRSDRRVYTLGSMWHDRPGYGKNPVTTEELIRVLDRLCDANDDSQQLLEATRLIQLSIGDIYIEQSDKENDTGYTARNPERLNEADNLLVVDFLNDRFPGDNPDVNRELARTLGMLRATRPGLLERITSMWTQTSDPTDDMHYLFVMAQLPGKRSSQVTQATVRALALLDHKLDERELASSRTWPLRVSSLFKTLASHDVRLADALVRDDLFGHPEHVNFVNSMSARALQEDATRAMLSRAKTSKKVWSPALIKLLDYLPAEEVLGPLRQLWSKPGLRDAIAKRLAKEKQNEDFDRLVESLASFDGNVALASSKALLEIDREPRTGQIADAVRALERHLHNANATKQIANLLQSWSGQRLGHQDVNAWRQWYVRTYPTKSALLGQANVASTDWRKRLTDIDFSTGDVAHGETVYEKRLCAACHSGSRRLGPSLKGITLRFGPEDFYLHVYEPNASISELYKAIEVTLKTGEVHIGVQVYESPAATLLETGMGELLRLNYRQIRDKRPATRSPMPNGLMNGATDLDLVDLYAYLKTL
jgi:putative membrane-bound dehydrogenase-like protein